MTIVTLYLPTDSDSYIEVDDLREAITGEPQNSATVTATLIDSANANVTGATNLSLAYVAGSNGRYRGLVPNNFSPDLTKTPFKTKIVVISGSLKRTWYLKTQVKNGEEI